MRFKIWAVAAAFAALAAGAANDRFFKESPNSINGFKPATDPLYDKECGGCHTAYLPGLLPARSWKLHMSRLEKHFGETVNMSAASQEAIGKYLADNAADKTRFEGSLTMMERVDPTYTPYRFMDVPLFAEMHRIILEVIDRKSKIKVRKLTNCEACHQMAVEGSFGNSELLIPGLTPTRKGRTATGVR